MPKKRFKNLRMAIWENDMTIGELAERLDKSQTYITNRMTARFSFTMDDVYEICSILDIPLEKIPEYFPKNGILDCKAS